MTGLIFCHLDFISFAPSPLSQYLRDPERVLAAENFPHSQSVWKPSLPETALPPKGATLPFSNRRELAR